MHSNNYLDHHSPKLASLTSENIVKKTFVTPRGISIQIERQLLPEDQKLTELVRKLDSERGMYLSSGIDFPDRYSQWEIGFSNPPLALTSRGRRLTVEALNPRGVALLEMLEDILSSDPAVQLSERGARRLVLDVERPVRLFAEEERSLQPSVFTPLRCLISEFSGLDDDLLGLYGAFGHDLIFQFEPLALRHARGENDKDMHVYLPDEIYILDRRRETCTKVRYEFARGGVSTADFDSTRFELVKSVAGTPAHTLIDATTLRSEPESDDYVALVEAARERMRVGDVYELVLHRRFSARGEFLPSELSREMRSINPSPYEFVCQFGEEQLIGTSPEMFIRVNGRRVESCPISGTVRRGSNAMEDAAAIKRLLNSEKDEVELTMCTDVDRNDKARICVPGSVRLLSRRMIERYAGLYHTVDHVEGTLLPSMTGIDAFLTHMWAVTLTGSPKPMAMRLIEEMEPMPRQWYGGAVGVLKFNGDVATGITIRTVHVRGDTAHYRVGATLVYDSIGSEEEIETRTKGTVFFRMLDRFSQQATSRAATDTAPASQPGAGKRIIILDNEDSFVHILADYFRQTGAHVQTYRHGLDIDRIVGLAPDLVVHSPGPGRPADFGVPELVIGLAELGIAQFGVCLGLQGIVEAFGGALRLLDMPRQGKTWQVEHDGRDLFDGLPNSCEVGAYHALCADEESVPECLEVTARTDAGVVMAVRHRKLPIRAVQFHPESILTMQDAVGFRLICNLVASLVDRKLPARAAISC